MTQYLHTWVREHRGQFIPVGWQEFPGNQAVALLRGRRPEPCLQGLVDTLPHCADANKQHRESAFGLSRSAAGIIHVLVIAIDVPSELFLLESPVEKSLYDEVRRAQETRGHLIFLFLSMKLLRVIGVLVIRG